MMMVVVVSMKSPLFISDVSPRIDCGTKPTLFTLCIELPVSQRLFVYWLHNVPLWFVFMNPRSNDYFCAMLQQSWFTCLKLLLLLLFINSLFTFWNQIGVIFLGPPGYLSFIVVFSISRFTLHIQHVIEEFKFFSQAGIYGSEELNDRWMSDGRSVSLTAWRRSYVA